MTEVADLREARRLLDAGFHLVKLHPMQKRPVGDNWNDPANKVTTIDGEATGYGVPLSVNRLVSIDPDNWALAQRGMAALGFDLEAIMAQGVRTTSTRPGSGGRSAFAEEPGLSWIKFASRDPAIGTVLELRADSPNLQDALPGTIYFDKAGNTCKQSHANDNRLDDAPGLPDQLYEFWQRCSEDLVFLRQVQATFMQACGVNPILAVSTGKSVGGKGLKLAYQSHLRRQFNHTVSVESILERHGYTFHSHLNRWSPATATGAPSVRLIPGKVDLWHSDHASDPLSGTFDAWIACVQLDFEADVLAAESAAAKFLGLEVDLTADLQKAEINAPHPLSLINKIIFSQYPQAVPYVIDGFIQEGVVFFAGQHGVGKTSGLIPLVLGAAGLHEPNYALAPKPDRWRHVIYVSEDPGQCERIVAAMCSRGYFSIEQVSQRLHVIPAQALNAKFIIQVVDDYKQMTASESGVDLLPLVVFDTRSACFALENENDNAEMSEAVAALKQSFGGLPVWVIAHISKEVASRGTASAMSVRGAGSSEGDAVQVLFLVMDESDHSRWLVRGKTRFEAKYKELQLRSELATLNARDRWGELVGTPVRWGVPIVPESNRTELAAKAAEELKKTALSSSRIILLDKTKKAMAAGAPLNRSELSQLLGLRKTEALQLITSMLDEGWLHSIVFEKKLAIHHAKSSFLVALTTEEHDDFMFKKIFPDHLLKVPPLYVKPDNVEDATAGLVLGRRGVVV